ncbi:alpha/beta hydrolase [Paraburkholderia aspalathi]|uniref:alpha/beta fold hydrolase n=1 Tax=Paraburkholderia aspalathi TaxID=1324617 RepID=UPI0038B8EEEF
MQRKQFVKSPTLIVSGRRDTVTPATAAWRAATRIPGCEFHLIDGNHFELHLEDEAVCLKNIALQLAFLKKRPGVDRPAQAVAA